MTVRGTESEITPSFPTNDLQVYPRHGGPRPRYALSTKLAYELSTVVIAIGLVNAFAHDTLVPELFVSSYSPKRILVVDCVEVHAELH